MNKWKRERSGRNRSHLMNAIVTLQGGPHIVAVFGPYLFWTDLFYCSRQVGQGQVTLLSFISKVWSPQRPPRKPLRIARAEYLCLYSRCRRSTGTLCCYCTAVFFLLIPFSRQNTNVTKLKLTQCADCRMVAFHGRLLVFSCLTSLPTHLLLSQRYVFW